MHPEKEKSHLNYIMQLKNSGIIDRALMSFSFAGPGGDEQSYAIFGGLNEDQIVGGKSGIKKMATMDYKNGSENNNWALKGESIFYGDEEIIMLNKKKDAKFPAIIDTGSSALGVPTEFFRFIKSQWENTYKELDCDTDESFC